MSVTRQKDEFSEKQTFLTPDTYTYMFVSNVCFSEDLVGFVFNVTPVLRWAILPYYRQCILLNSIRAERRAKNQLLPCWSFFFKFMCLRLKTLQLSDFYLIGILGQILGVIASPRPKLLTQTQDNLLKNCFFLAKFLQNITFVL